MSARRLTCRTTVLLLALVSIAALQTSSACAFVTHEFLPGVSAKLTEGVPTQGPHGEQVVTPGPFDNLKAMTVDSGQLYVAEGQEKSRIDKFDTVTGAFLSQLPELSSPLFLNQGVAVGHSTGEAQLYIAGDVSPEGSTRGAVAVIGPAGSLKEVWTGTDVPFEGHTPSEGFGCFACNSGPGDVAVDDSESLSWAAGDVYVVDPERKVIDVFKPEASGGEAYVTQLTGESSGATFSGRISVAVNQSNDEVVVADQEQGTVERFKPAPVVGQYEFVGKLADPDVPFESISSVAVDGGAGDIYVAAGGLGKSVVYQFDSEGVFLGLLRDAPTGPSGEARPFELVESVAIDPVSHDVYVADDRQRESTTVMDVFGPNVVIPDVTTAAPTGVNVTGGGSIEATLNGTVNPDDEGEASCGFVWGTSEEFGQVASCEPGKVADGMSPMPVRATLRGLQPDTTYYYRLQATNKNGTNTGESFQDEQFTTPGPAIRGESVANVRAESASFNATIDPHDGQTSYYFQYGTSGAYGSTAPVLSAQSSNGTEVGSDEGNVEVTQHIQGLSAATAYHYRVVAVSEVAAGRIESFYGPDQTFSTQLAGAAVGLPDGRAWEMVSPPQKEGARLGSDGNLLVQASAQGNAFMDWASAPTEAESAGADNSVNVFFGRGANGWSSKVITPPHTSHTNLAIGNGLEYRFFSEDLSKGIVQPFGTVPLLSPEASEATAYLRTDYTAGNSGELCEVGCYQPLVSSANTASGVKFGEEESGECEVLICGAYFLGATPDLSHIVLRSEVSLTSIPTEGYRGLYESNSGSLTVVNLLPEGEHNEQGGPVGMDPSLGNDLSARHAISEDGSRVIWQGKTSNAQGEHLYLRDTEEGQTIRLDVFQGVEKGSETNSLTYMTASSDDSRIFFLDGERLTNDSTATDNIPDLYEYNLEAPQGNRLTDLTVEKNGHANVKSVLGASEDGSYLYFTASGALAPGASQGNCSSGATQGLCNLYLWHDGKTTFIAGLSQQDSPDWGLKPIGVPDRVSPDGHRLAFMSDRNLTGYDTTDAISKQADEEVYLYDATDNKLVCASCDPTGALPSGVEAEKEELAGGDGFSGHVWVAADVPAWSELGFSESRYQPRYLSNSGRLFFDSSDALVPQDVNGTQDVYEYEPVGIGNCALSAATYSERSGGCVGLISSGSSNEESAFLDASETGGDVFFLTLAKLVPADFDNALDIYDARECGAQTPCFPTSPVAPPPCSTGDGCKAAPSPQPEIFGSPSSATFSGAGNVVSPGVSSTVKPKSVTRAQKLAQALRACLRKKRGKQRIACNRQARKRYGGKAAHRSRRTSHPSRLTGR